MKIIQIINNNVVLSEDVKGNEIVVFGKGIGFRGKRGEEIHPEEIRKIYHLEDNTEKTRIVSLLEEIPYEIINFGLRATEYIAACSVLPISPRILIPLTDHIYTAIERAKNHVSFEKGLSWNVRYLYRDEYHTAGDIVDMIKSDFGVDLEPDETAFIALHIVNAEMGIDLKDTYKATGIIDLSVRMIEEYFNIKLDPDNLNYGRFITHMQFLTKRIITNTFELEDDEEMIKYTNYRYPDAYDCALKICDAIRKQYQMEINKNEYSYLTIHIARLLKRGLD